MGKVNIKKKAKKAAAAAATAAAKQPETATSTPPNPFELSDPSTRPRLPTAEDFETKSVISFKALHGVTKSKKERLKLRKKLWHDKIQLCKEKSKKRGAKKSKSDAGSSALSNAAGFQLLLDSLPSVQDRVTGLKSATTVERATDNGSKQRNKSEKQKHNDMLKNVDTFKKVLEHPEFRKNPLDTMILHLKNKQEMEKNGELLESVEGRPAPKKVSRNTRRKMERRRRMEISLD